MSIRCLNCDQADLESNIVISLPGTVRGEDYTVEMLGLKCPYCGYETVDGAAMPEYARQLADKYRAAHGLLTSDDIRTRRQRLDMNQQEFADYLGVGVASIKRWEMGKIQDPRNNALIVEKTTEPVLSSVQMYTMHSAASSGSTMCALGNGGQIIYSVTVEACLNPNLIDGYFDATPERPIYRSQCNERGWTFMTINSPTYQTVPPHIAWFFRKKERHSYARSH
jgi:putative zinc finger/helix-turn-helix YgiT family protein